MNITTLSSSRISLNHSVDHWSRRDCGLPASRVGFAFESIELKDCALSLEALNTTAL
jgi:hypothetical protein